MRDAPPQQCNPLHLNLCLAVQIFNMSSGLASMGNLAANLRGEGIYQFAASYGLAYRASKAALCMGKPCLLRMSARFLRLRLRSFLSTLERRYCTGAAKL